MNYHKVTASNHSLTRDDQFSLTLQPMRIGQKSTFRTFGTTADEWLADWFEQDLLPSREEGAPWDGAVAAQHGRSSLRQSARTWRAQHGRAVADGIAKPVYRPTTPGSMMTESCSAVVDTARRRPDISALLTQLPRWQDARLTGAGARLPLQFVRRAVASTCCLSGEMEPLIGLKESVTESVELCPYTRSFRPSDRDDVNRLLCVLPRLYPGGSDWLQQKLTDSLGGKAKCIVVQDIVSLNIVAAAIVTPKTSGSLKLSTLYVAKKYRSLGIGSLLLAELIGAWDQQNISDVYVTVAHHIEGSLAKLIEPVGFRPVTLVKDRYGAGRHEAVWRRI